MPTHLLSHSAADGETAIHADPLIGALLVGADVDAPGGAEKVLRAFRARNDRAPTFLLGARSQVPDIPLSTLKLATEFTWLTEDSTTSPGSGHEIHGVEVRDGEQFLYCVNR